MSSVGLAGGWSEAVPHVVHLTPNTVELIPTLGALPPPRRARPGPDPHSPTCLACHLASQDGLVKVTAKKAAPRHTGALELTRRYRGISLIRNRPPPRTLQ